MNMAIDIRVLDGEGALEVAYSPDEVTRTELIAQRQMVAEALSGRALKKVLIDATAIARMPSVATLFDHNWAVASNDILQPVRYAVVFRALDSDVQFLENSARNRGLEIKCFTSREEALGWLRG
jgi:hypothetical protein